MPLTPQSVPKVDFRAVNKAQKMKSQQRTKSREINKDLKSFMFKGFGFRPSYSERTETLGIEGPLCPRKDRNDEPCFNWLQAEDKICSVCGFSAGFPLPHQLFRETALRKYQGRQRFLESGGDIQTLDVPYEAIKEKSKKETRKIKIKWSQKDGRNMAVIYFIDTDVSAEKAHLFVDFDRQEIRHDAKDVSPGKILAEVSALFPKTKIDIEYQEAEKK